MWGVGWGREMGDDGRGRGRFCDGVRSREAGGNGKWGMGVGGWFRWGGGVGDRECFGGRRDGTFWDVSLGCR